MEKADNLPKKPSEKRTQYPTGSEHYTVFEEIGKGVSALVHRALCIPLNEIVAIKILDFERDKCDLVQFFAYFLSTYELHACYFFVYIFFLCLLNLQNTCTFKVSISNLLSSEVLLSFGNLCIQY